VAAVGLSKCFLLRDGIAYFLYLLINSWYNMIWHLWTFTKQTAMVNTAVIVVRKRSIAFHLLRIWVLIWTSCRRPPGKLLCAFATNFRSPLSTWHTRLYCASVMTVSYCVYSSVFVCLSTDPGGRAYVFGLWNHSHCAVLSTFQPTSSNYIYMRSRQIR